MTPQLSLQNRPETKPLAEWNGMEWNGTEHLSESHVGDICELRREKVMQGEGKDIYI